MGEGGHAAGSGKHLFGAVLSFPLTNLVMPPDSVLPTLLRNLELVLGKYQSHVFCLGEDLVPELLIRSGRLGMLFLQQCVGRMLCLMLPWVIELAGFYSFETLASITCISMKLVPG